MPRHDSDVAYVFGGRTWGEHLIMKRNQNGAPRRKCPCLAEDCKGIWLECWGEKNVPYIRRCPEQEGGVVGSCGMTVDHANAQAGIAGMLRLGKEIRVTRQCVTCRRVHVQTIRLSEGEECRQEAFFRNERKNFADLGILPKGAERGTRPTMIIEILRSSATLEENRPDGIPWFEIKAVDVNNQTELFAKDPLHSFEFDCQRKLVCDECVTKTRLEEARRLEAEDDARRRDILEFKTRVEEARRVPDTMQRVADQRIAKHKRMAQEMEADKEQRRIDYEAACIAEKDYYRRLDSHLFRVVSSTYR